MDIKKDIERLLLFLIPAIFLEKLLATISLGMFTKILNSDAIEMSMWSSSPVEIITIATTFKQFASLIPALVIAIWLWNLEKKVKGRHILWAVGAITLKYWILLLFIGYRLYDKDKYSDSEKN